MYIFVNLEAVMFRFESRTLRCVGRVGKVFNPLSQFSMLGIQGSYSFVFVCTLWVRCVGSGLPSILLFLYDYRSNVVCYTHVFTNMYTVPVLAAVVESTSSANLTRLSDLFLPPFPSPSPSSACPDGVPSLTPSSPGRLI